MYQSLRKVLPAVVLLALVAGCNNPKEASNSNFRKVLQTYFDANPACTLATIHEFPQEFEEGTAAEDRQLKALAQVGLLRATKFQKEIVPLFSWNHKKVLTNFVRYELTEAGSKVIVEKGSGIAGGIMLCFAKRHVIAISSYTEPGEMMGMKVSHVKFSYEYTSPEPWASQPAIQEAYAEIKRMIQSPKSEGQATLVLTGDGWKHSDEVR